jgi:hypothetical protein
MELAMEFLASIQINTELVPQLLAILGLLVTWEVHALGVRAGRIKPRPIFDLSRFHSNGDSQTVTAEKPQVREERAKRLNPREVFDLSGVRCWVKSHAGVHMYIQMTPDDDQTCPTCRQGSGRVYSPTALKHPKFKLLERPCSNPAGCRCQLVGLVGNWEEGEELWRSLDDSPKGLALSPQRLTNLLKGANAAPRGTGQDRVNLYVLEALHAEGTNPVFAMSRYRSMIRHALEGHDHPYVVPAYMRLCELLERSGNLTAALTACEDFAKHVKDKKFLCGPSHLQVKAVALRRVRLIKTLQST